MCLHVRFMPQKLLTRVNYVKLFNLLLERNLPGVIIWLLFESYSRRSVYTRWNSALSDPIPTENWVKPGGVLSPMLLCKYFDDLLKRIERTGIDHHIGHHFYGGLGCADDVIALPYVDCIYWLIHVKHSLLRTTLHFTQERLCTYLGHEKDLWILCKFHAKLPSNTLGIILIWTSVMKQVLGRKGDILLQSQIGGILSFSLYKVKLSLLQTYCTAWYGCQAGHLGTTLTDEMNVECREAVRRIGGLLRQTRSVLCPGLAGNENFHTQHERRV